MVRKQVYVTAEQDVLLKKRSAELGVTEAELVRRGIDHVCATDEAGRRKHEAWERLKAAIAQRKRIGVPQTGRNWTREELYDDRPDHFSD